MAAHAIIWFDERIFGLPNGGYFFVCLHSITDITVLETMREALALRAPEADMNWPNRLKMYKQIELIIDRITLLEKSSYS